jgi:hypothetical protein
MTHEGVQVADTRRAAGDLEALAERLEWLAAEIDSIRQQIDVLASESRERPSDCDDDTSASKARIEREPAPQEMADTAEFASTAEPGTFAQEPHSEGDHAAATPAPPSCDEPAGVISGALADHLSDFLGSTMFGDTAKWTVADMRIVCGGLDLQPPSKHRRCAGTANPAIATESFPSRRRPPSRAARAPSRRVAIAAGVATSITAALLAIGQQHAFQPRRHAPLLATLFNGDTSATVLWRAPRHRDDASRLLARPLEVPTMLPDLIRYRQIWATSP